MVVWSSPSVKQLTVAADHRFEEPQFCFLHSDDVSSNVNPCLLQAPKQLSAFVLGKKSEDKNLAKGTISLSKQIRQQLDVQPGDKLNVSFPTATNCKNIVLQPITDNSAESDWFSKFVEPFFKPDCVPYPVHNNTVVEMVNSEGERQNFMVYEINNKTESFFGFVDKNTNINVCGTFSPQHYDKMRRRIGFADLGGVDNAIDQIRMMVEIPLTDPDIFETIGVEPSYGILLHGPSGTGKTTIAKAVADEIGVFIHVINGPEIIGKHAGEAEENIRKAFEICQQQTSAILFIDEIDAIAPKRDKAQSDLEKRVVSQLLASMEGVSGRGRVAVLAATNRPNALDPALRRYGRFDKEIEIGVPDQKARLKILQIKTKRMTGVFADGVDLEEIAAKSHGYVGADLAALVTDAGHRCAMRIRNEIRSSPTERQKILSNARVTKEDFEVSMEKMSPSALRETLVETPKVEWDAIGGLDEVKKNIQEMIQFPIQHAEKYEKFGTPPSRGVLFYGPPGCGKTLLAKAAATMCGANFISVKGPELLTMWLGESEANVRELFDRARGAAPCILFFDEIDSIAPKRGSGDSGGATDRIINQLLTELDGIGQKKNVFIIGATNRPDCMDNAILRPGRLDQLIYIPLPDKLGRLQILRANLGIDVKTGENKKGIIDPDVDLEFLAEFSNGYSGADLADICCRAVKCAISEEIETGDKVDRLTRAHFESVMMDARMSVKEEDIRRFEIMVNTYTRKESATIFKFPEASSSAQNGYHNGSESEDDYS